MTDELFEYVLRDLVSPQGAFYSAEDADSEGEEGVFYLWTVKELKDILTREQFGAVSQVWELSDEGNWIDGATGQLQPTNILHQSIGGTQKLYATDGALRDQFQAARRRLLQHRDKRPRPLRDEKILADWNGLMIAALARGGRLLDQPRYVRAAGRAFEFVDVHLRNDQDRLQHCWCDGEAIVPAFLDDYIFLAWGALELYGATYDPGYLRSAVRLVADVEQRFLDEAEGGYCYTADDAPRLPLRPKKYGDMEVPSGNSVAMLVLTQLARLTGQPEYEQRAEQLERLLSRGLLYSPSWATYAAMAVEYRRRPSAQVVIVGRYGAADTQRMLTLAERSASRAAVSILLKDVADQRDRLCEIVPFVQNYTQLDGRATAYVCRNRTCKDPTTDAQVMQRQLDEIALPAQDP
jgi:uncharacterized protein YyaL (SSP411 family)